MTAPRVVPPTQFNVKDYGAKGDGSTDDTTAIRAALADAAANFGGTVYFPWDKTVVTYMISDRIVLSNLIVFRGENSNTGGGTAGVRIKALAGFPVNRPMFTLGPQLPVTGGSNQVFGTRLQNLHIDCNNIAAVGVYTNKAQEQSGIINCSIRQFTQYGIHMACPNTVQQANNETFRDLVIGQSASAGVAYATTTFTGSAPVVAVGTSADSLTNYINDVTTPGQGTGVVTVTSTTGAPSAGSFICAQTSNGRAVVVYYTGLTSTSFTGCKTDSTAGITIDTTKVVEWGSTSFYSQSTGAQRGIDGLTCASTANIQGVGVRLDGCGGFFSRMHFEQLKYGVLLGQAQSVQSPTIGPHIHGNDATMTDLIRIAGTYSGNAHASISIFGVKNDTASMNTINDLLVTGNAIKETGVAYYLIGDSTYKTGGKKVISDSSEVVDQFTRGLATMALTTAAGDTDFSFTPPDGTLVVDNTQRTLRYRANSGWRQIGVKTVNTKVASYTVPVTFIDDVLYVDATAGNVIITLFAATGNSGRELVIKRKDATGNTITITAAAGETIDGSASTTLVAQYSAVTIVSNGANWIKTAVI